MTAASANMHKQSWSEFTRSLHLSRSLSRPPTLSSTMASSDSDADNVRHVKKRVKGTRSIRRPPSRGNSPGKEKKKKDKIADLSDHSEIQPQITKGGRKKRRAEEPEIPAEAEPVSSNPVGEERKKWKRDREGEEPLSGDKKEKKKRKEEKSSGTTHNPAVDADDEVSPPKSKSKPKKRKNGETVEGEDHASTAIPTDDHSSRKRKKSKASVHPDPSTDPNLTEQSQKGSHVFSPPSKS